MEAVKLESTDPGMINQTLYTLGVDLGQARDPTAVCVLESVTGERVNRAGHTVQRYRPLHRVRHLERLPLGMPYPEQITYVCSLLDRPPLGTSNPHIFIDFTGVGRPCYDLFQQARIPNLKGVTITGGNKAEPTPQGWSVPKTELVSLVQAKLHAGDLKIAKELADAPALLRELQDFRVRFTSAGNATFGAREGAHDDLVLALATAVFGAEHRQTFTVQPLGL